METFTPIYEELLQRFAGQRKPVAKNLALTICAILKNQSSSLGEIVRGMGSLNGADFHTNDIRLWRFLQNAHFQVDDPLFRIHIKMLWEILQEKGLSSNRLIPINIDYTTKNDEFLILQAAIPFQGRALPVYFSLRNYPKKANQMDQKHMEAAFFKALAHLLPQKYSYVLVLDRGFASHRIIQCLESLGFYYVLRFNPNLKVKPEAAVEYNLQDLDPKKSYDFKELMVKKWKKSLRILKTEEYKGSSWYLMTNIKNFSSASIAFFYENRFKIEKLFQDQKTAGFNIESSKLQKYNRFKRLYFCLNFAAMLLMFIGDWVESHNDPIKKNYALHLKLLSPFSN